MNYPLRDNLIIIGEANSLKHIKDNIFVNEKGVRYYLDTYGFHTVNQLYNSRLISLTHKVLNLALRITNLEKNFTVVGKKTRQSLRRITNNTELTPFDKVKLIKEYLDAPYDEAEMLVNELEYVESMYTNQKP